MNKSNIFYKFGLIGHPVEHSYSAHIHELALEVSNLKGEYFIQNIDPTTASNKLPEIIEDIRYHNIDGFNVTIPYKERIIDFLESFEPAAQAIGAVNTIALHKDQVVGFNTDYIGFYKDLLHNKFIEPNKTGTALVLGAGGSARAAAYSLSRENWDVIIAARNQDQAQKLSQDINPSKVKSIDYSSEEITAKINDCDLLINCTSIGMWPHMDKHPLPKGVVLPSKIKVYDLVYNPIETELIKYSRAAGLKAVGGLGVLIEQALDAFKIWTGLAVGRDQIMDQLLERITASKVKIQ